MQMLLRADQNLVRAARRGDQVAFAELVERHYAVLVASCRRILGDADIARDAAQEAVLRALLGLDRLRDDTRFGAWLVGIGLNVCRTLLGAREVRVRSLEALEDGGRRGELSAAAAEPVELFIAGELTSQVRAAIATLPHGQRQAVALFYLGGLTHAETAQELGTQPGAVKTRLHKARKSLRASLLNAYKEYVDMTDQTAQLIPMHIAELRRTSAPGAADDRHIVFLEDDEERRLPIWIGSAEATALAVILEDVQLPRPGVYQFAAALLAGAGGRLREVRVTELTSSTFYAQAILCDGTSVDARPSDALTLALVTGVPIFVSAGVLEHGGEHQAKVRDFLPEADAPADDAHIIAEEVKARIAANAVELAGR